MPGQALACRRVSMFLLPLAWVLLYAPGCASGRSSSAVVQERTLLSHKLANVDDFGTLLVDAGLPTADLPRDEYLSSPQMRDLLLRLELERPKPSEEAPWVVANLVLREASAQKRERVAKTELSRRLRAFENLYVLRRDGYFAHALSGRAVQCVGPVEVRDGTLRAGAFEVERFYTRDAKQQWNPASTVAMAPAR